MTTPRQHPNPDKPSARLLEVLAEMAAERGVTYEVPTTAARGRAEFRRLRAIPRSHRGDARREREEIRAALERGYGTAPREHELGGWGSTAHWRSDLDDG